MNVTIQRSKDHSLKIEYNGRGFSGAIRAKKDSPLTSLRVMWELADDVLSANIRLRDLSNNVNQLRANASKQYQIRQETEDKYYVKVIELEKAHERIADLEKQVFAMAQNNSEFVAAHQKVVKERDIANQRYKDLDDKACKEMLRLNEQVKRYVGVNVSLSDQLRMAQDDNERLRREKECLVSDMTKSGSNAHKWFNDGREAASKGFDAQSPFEPLSLCNLVWQWGHRTQSLRDHLSDARKNVKRLNKLVPKKKKLKLTPKERDMLKTMASSLGLSFEQLCEDHVNIGGNYSSARASMEAFEKAIKPMRVINQINADDVIREHLLSEEGKKKVLDVIRRNSKAVKAMNTVGNSDELTEKLKKLKPSEFMSYVLNAENLRERINSYFTETGGVMHAGHIGLRSGEIPATLSKSSFNPAYLNVADVIDKPKTLRDYLKSGQKPRVKMYKEEARRSVGYDKFGDRSEIYKAELVGELIDFPNHFVILLNGSHRFVAAHEIKCTGPSPTISDVLTHKASGELWSVYRIQKERLDAATIFTLNTPRGNQCSVKESELSQYFIW